MSAWDRIEAERDAVAMFGNQALHTAAAVLAGAHPRALDYIRQAPVIVLSSNAGHVGRLSASRVRGFAGPPMRMMAERGDKLRDVMAFYGCALHLRKLAPSVLHPKRWPTVYHLGRLPPSTLAQTIPEARKEQDVWLRALTVWIDHMRRRCGNPWLLFDWAAVALRAVQRGHEDTVTSVADMAIEALTTGQNRGDAIFVERWTLTQAETAAGRWHARLGRLRAERVAAKDLGFEWSMQVPYAPLPDDPSEVAGFEFVPLRSCEALHVEGAAMRHCVASYSRDVIGGTSRVFSVRKDGRRVATADYRRSTPDGWISEGAPFRLSQIKGPCNAKAPAAVQHAAVRFARDASALAGARR